MQRKNLNYQKYLKYKNKYLNLRNQIGGNDEEVNKLVKNATDLINNNKFEEAVNYLYDHPILKERVLAFRKIRNDNTKEVLEKLQPFIEARSVLYQMGLL
jgi:hypothetical protein